MSERYVWRFRREVPGYCCKWCGEPVGYLGRFLAFIFGNRFHGCDFRNTKHPQEL